MMSENKIGFMIIYLLLFALTLITSCENIELKERTDKLEVSNDSIMQTIHHLEKGIKK